MNQLHKTIYKNEFEELALGFHKKKITKISKSALSIMEFCGYLFSFSQLSENKIVAM